MKMFTLELNNNIMVMNIIGWLWKEAPVEYSKRYFERIQIEVESKDLIIPVESQKLLLSAQTDEIELNVDKSIWLEYSWSEIILELKC